MGFRDKPSGWRYESSRHSLAAMGISTNARGTGLLKSSTSPPLDHGPSPLTHKCKPSIRNKHGEAWCHCGKRYMATQEQQAVFDYYGQDPSTFASTLNPSPDYEAYSENPPANIRKKFYAKKVNKVDFKKYAGTWKEKTVSPVPWYEKGLHDVKATYEPQTDGSVKVTNTGITKEGRVKKVEGVARPITSDNKKLQVSFGFLRSGTYEIVDVDPKYKQAVVKDGTGTVWVLERTT